MGRCFALSFALIGVLCILLPDLSGGRLPARSNTYLIQLEDIPETRQVRHLPALVRPTVPLMVEGFEEPEESRIELVELDLDRLSIESGPLSIPAIDPFTNEVPFQEEEIFEYRSVQQKPVLKHQRSPVYPRAALRSGKEGTVYVRFVVNKDGKVTTAEILQGPDIFYRSALEAVSLFAFQPALQDDKPVSVRMVVPIEFKLDIKH